MHKRDRVRLLAVEGQEVVAVFHDDDIDKVRAYCLQKFGVKVHLTAWKHASAEQRRAAELLPVTIIPMAGTSESVRAYMGKMTAGGAS
jgi:hypothetical protein